MAVELDDLTSRLWSAYDAYKTSEVTFAGEAKNKKNRKTGLKEEFLDAVTELVAKGTLAQKTVFVEADALAEAEEEARRRNPRWLIISSGYDADRGGFGILLEEDPYYKPFAYVNRRRKIVVAKQVVDGSPYLDDKLLKEKDPELYLRVTRMVNESLVKEIIYNYERVSNEKRDEYAYHFFESMYDHERTLIPLEELDGDTLAAIQDYIYPGAPVVKLAQPREAKLSELGDEYE